MLELLLGIGKKKSLNHEEVQKLVANDGASGDYFGYSVAVSADSSAIVVGAYCDDDNGADSGSAYVYIKQVSGLYTQSQKLVAADGASSDYFGISVAISADGSVIAIGAYYDDDKGSAYVFTRQANSSYTQSQKLVASDGAASDIFGYNVAISGDSSAIIVGAYGDDDKGSASGSAYVYTKQANSSYTQSQKLVASDGAADDFFGIRVAVSADSSAIVVVAYRDDDKGADSGSTYVFKR